ncbi:acetyl-CoA hydrolase/transferase C-terminal domain-containing protein [Novosphingobium sp. MMS21-SN21R]|uniref:acetyl-CoA hydrolase/transferase family protein n=1 Tax=Novosphingobium sp. MMS21-SN21R TaxID=2969298 RepID=UPI002883919A|nr:acetyl-CoA hydrolase/transferase C-terminal domain-containing protein [Novosphingobium sp. MMS21-SN21R]MDT0508467.1 acetyl-CoA hydrolase/transferase C-terminal domain-containing protein [Novosphingobium sp. MMS21-SN21R]
MKPRHLRPGDLPGVLPPGGLTLVSASPAESDLLVAEVAAAGPALGAMRFSGIFVPGLNKATWSAGPEASILTFFQTPELKREGQRSRFLPLCYHDILRHYRRNPPAAALMMCSPPDENGHCSFGAETAFIAALWPEIPVRIAHINPLMPRTPGDPGIPFSKLTGYFESAQPLRTMNGGTDAISEAIAALIAPFVPDGATLQTGLGKIPDAVLRALGGHRGLRLHSGLIGDGALALVRSGAMAAGPSALAGVAIGSAELYAGLDHPHFQFRPVTVTHDPAALARIDKLVTINSAMEVDLYGQVHAEASSRGFMSGPGGAGDYARGARASDGGLRIIALPSSAGSSSRIVPAAAGHGPVSLSRFDVDLVVTENGVADLRDLGHDQRAQALISIAAPSHREGLARGWRDSMNALKEQ